MNKRNKRAITEVKKALKWIILSGAMTTALNAVYSSVGLLESGEIDCRTFLIGMAFTLTFMILNTGLYYVHEYRKD